MTKLSRIGILTFAFGVGLGFVPDDTFVLIGTILAFVGLNFCVASYATGKGRRVAPWVLVSCILTPITSFICLWVMGKRGDGLVG